MTPRTQWTSWHQYTHDTICRKMHPKHWGSMSTWRRCSHPPSNFSYDRALSLILKQWMMTFDGHIWASPKRSCTLDQKSFVGHLWSDIIWEDSLQSKTTHVYQEIICRWRISRQHILSFAAKHSHFETSNSHMTVRSSHLTVLLLHMTVGNVIGHPPRCSWSTMTWHINITPYVNECEWCKWRHKPILVATSPVQCAYQVRRRILQLLSVRTLPRKLLNKLWQNITEHQPHCSSAKLQRT